MPEELNDTLEPTVVSAAAAEMSHPSSDVSRWDVAFVGDTKPQLSTETALLLRNRLKAAALVLLLALAVAFVRTLFQPDTPNVVLRSSVLIVLLLVSLLLRSRKSLSLGRLRLLELVTFGVVGVQLVKMVCDMLLRYAAENDAASAVAVCNMRFAAASVLILIYGMLMPNTWKRAALILLPAACLPLLLIAALEWYSKDVAKLLSFDQFGLPIPLPLVAAFAAVYGTHVIDSMRREAFKAKRFGQYQLKEQLGAGGMGEVYRAEHLLLKRPCAIKLIKPGSENDAIMLARFEREVRATAKLTHWNTVEIFDFGRTEDGTFYYVMELLPGKSLDQLVRSHGPLPAERVIHFLRQVCGALAEAHAMGLIHRDIKPANIFAAERGGVRDVAKLLDFGLVKVRPTSTAVDAELTQQGSFSGSPLFTSPEQTISYRDVDARSDIYSLGTVAYYLLTGRPPFEGKNPIEVLIAHSRDPVVPPSEHRPEIPADMERVVLRCLEKKPDDRFEDVQSLKKALSECESAGAWNDQRAAEWWRENEDDGSGVSEVKA